MAKRALLSAVIGSIALLGCATPAPNQFAEEGTSLKCNGQNRCWVKTHVYNCGLTGCDISVNYGLVEVSPGITDNITWELVDSLGYQFPNDAVVFEDACRTIFAPCNRESSGVRFVCKNNHPSGKVQSCKYTIKATGPMNVHPLDPWVVNQ